MFLQPHNFKYPWRKYQANVLTELATHMHDDKLHIVAAPGSGKTILGLEIMLKYWRKHVGRGQIIFTRNAKGRQALLSARKGSFDYDDKFHERKRATLHDQWV